MAKRTKHVFSTSEIPHLWAHKVQDSARNAQGNLYFEGDSIWSYGSHFELGRHVTNKKGERAVLLNSDTYSVTTSSQQSAVRGAIPPDVLKLYVSGLQNFGSYRIDPGHHTKRLAQYATDIEQHLIKSTRARSSYRKEGEQESAQQLTEERNAWVRFFGLRNKPLANVPALDSAEMQAIKVKEAARVKIESAKKKQEKAEQLARMAQAIADWKNGTGNPEGNYVWYWKDVPTMLRVKNGNVETSQGAVVPVAHAKRALTLVRAVLSRGESWATNGHTCYLGHYKLDRIEADGTLKAGCHVITRDEWERIAPQLDALQVAETPQTMPYVPADEMYQD